jgi:uncharacterized protein (DUF1919 family)
MLNNLSSWLSAQRSKAARRYLKRHLRTRAATIVSDDCWAGKIYEDFGIRCLSPFVKMGFSPPEYLTFLQHMREPEALELLSISSKERGYPIIETKYARLFGMHYRTEFEFQRSFGRRAKLIDWDKLYIKIDLGRKDTNEAVIARWNELKLPNSVALYPNTPNFQHLKIHHGVCVPDWTALDIQNIPRSCRRFDVVHWLNTGEIKRSWWSKWRYILLFDHEYLRQIKRRYFKYGR